MSSRFALWQKWLLVVGVIIAAFGAAMALLSGTALFDVLFDRQIDPAFWGANGVDAAARQFQQWSYAVLGATVAGWGIFVVFIAAYPFKNGGRWAWNCLVVGLGAWYILDTTLSLVYGVYFNALFNTLLLVLAGIPILATRREFANR